MGILLTTTVTATVKGQTQTTYSLHVGAWGDNDSVGNNGVQVDIRTHIEDVVQPTVTYSFWVGSILINGAFIQFGYELVLPDNRYCLYGERTVSESGGGSFNSSCFASLDYVGSGDARWFWQYWPSGAGQAFYFALGPAYSAGPDGSWHTYQIVPNEANGWNFVLDGKMVQNFNDYPPTTSKDAVFMVAEEVTDATSSGNLGPVEFRNLEYSKNGSWQPVRSLKAVSDCVPSNRGVYELGAYCGISNPYGVRLNGPNDIIAGADQTQVLGGTMLWGNPSFTLQVPNQVEVTLDGVLQEPGTVQLALPIGVHYVTVPNLVQVNNGTRLIFVDWTIGVQTIFGPNITINLHSDYKAEAIYVTQYELTLAASPYSPESEGWYDSGSIGNYSIRNQFLPIIFVGWFDESGNLITTATSGTISMDAPHTVVPEWRVNYALIAAYAVLVIAIASVGVFWRRSRRKSSKRHHGWLLSPLEHDR
jgi:hypothetical protein